MYTLLTFLSLFNLGFSYYVNENSHYKDYNEQYNNNDIELYPDSQPMYQENELISEDPVKHSALRQMQYPTELPKVYTLKESFFSILFHKQVGATTVLSIDYPWIAQVFHSEANMMPFICTAACIEANIFVTAARCIAQAKIKYVNVYYKGNAINPVALVLPSKKTQQMFDDIGFIVTNFSKHTNSWWRILPSHGIKRNSRYFGWFNQWRRGKVLGYVADPDKLEKYHLYSLNVVMSNFLCQNMYSVKQDINNYFVPCYHSCDLIQDYNREAVCNKYLAGEGHVVLADNKLIGIATWGHPDNQKKAHPVGMAVINSASYKEDYSCAKRIKNALAHGSTVIPTC